MAVAVDGGDPSAATVPLGGTVQTVLDSPRIAPAPANCGKTWDTRRIPLEEYAQLCRTQSRFRWIPLAAAVEAALPEGDREPAELEHQGRVARLSCR
jgi:hypothetical protein